jgi:hypothetical protein
MKESIVCKCGGIYSKNNKQRHKKSKQHREYKPDLVPYLWSGYSDFSYQIDPHFVLSGLESRIELEVKVRDPLNRLHDPTFRESFIAHCKVEGAILAEKHVA